jgi:hypothetical protein
VGTGGRRSETIANRDMTEENTTNEEQKHTRFSLVIFFVFTCIFIAFAFFARLPDTVAIFLIALVILIQFQHS